MPKLQNIYDFLRDAERRHILKALALTDGNKTEAAKMLGVSRKTLWQKMKVHGLPASRMGYARKAVGY